MKHLRQTRHTFKHRQAGKVLSDRIPAYNSAGKEYKRILPPLANPKEIDTRLLTNLINKKSSNNNAELTDSGFILNGYQIHLQEGFASTESLKFRFVDVLDLLRNLYQERILKGSMEDIRILKDCYKNE
jgi:hypothetical protein